MSEHDSLVHGSGRGAGLQRDSKLGGAVVHPLGVGPVVAASKSEVIRAISMCRALLSASQTEVIRPVVAASQSTVIRAISCAEKYCSAPQSEVIRPIYVL